MRTRWSPSAVQGLDTCPRRHALREAGWEPKPNPLYPSPPHAEFGRTWHASAEEFDTRMFMGQTRPYATEAAIRYAFTETWVDGAPLGGEALDEWRCAGGKLPSEKTGRLVQCPASKGWWAAGEAQGNHYNSDGAGNLKCVRCGGPVELRRAFEPTRSSRGTPTVKTRPNLLRAVLDYCDEALEGVGEWNGAPALEVDFPFSLAGIDLHCILDRYTTLGTSRFAHERKTSSIAPFWDGYLQTYQVRFYPEALRQNGLRCDGVLLEHYQIFNGGTQRATTTLTPGPDHLVEAVERLVELVNTADAYDGADPLDWPGRLSACSHARGGQSCEFLKVCKVALARRPELLQAEFEQSART